MLLQLESIDACYGFLQTLWNVSLEAEAGEYVCILGPNGAGKSTILKAICCLLKPTKGNILFKGERINQLRCNEACNRGISCVSEQLNLFTAMTVQENLEMGAFSTKDREKETNTCDYCYQLFPVLQTRRKQLAGTLSGGERKMLAIARGLMSSPAILMLDEPSLGLAPIPVATVFEALSLLNTQGLTLLLVEQNVQKSLRVAKRGYILEKGRVVLQGITSDLIENNHIRKLYLGL
jgi:ABC-type branched-subunit amino acid transport system ATPase component